MSITVAHDKFKLFFTLVVLMLWMSACANDLSYDRHNLSRLWQEPYGASDRPFDERQTHEQTIYFEATANAQYPIDSGSAESIRLLWINEWLGLRNLCPRGHKVLQRKVIDRAEINPYRHNLRYSIACH